MIFFSNYEVFSILDDIENSFENNSFTDSILSTEKVEKINT